MNHPQAISKAIESLDRRGLIETIFDAPDQTIRAPGGVTVFPSFQIGEESSVGPKPITAGGLPLLTGADNPHSPPDLDLRETLGEGGMGLVRLAVQRSLRREVAVKSLKEGFAESQMAADGLIREALFTGYLEHPNIVPVHQLGRSPDGQPVLVMKRIEGISWSTLLSDPDHEMWANRTEDRLTANLNILRKVCFALSFAHAKDILHRDIKPENVMVGAYGEVYLVDWGLAMYGSDARPSTMTLGTPAYMAPEMLEGGGTVTTRTDVYLLGATLHHVLTGQPPHQGSSVLKILLSVHRSEFLDHGEDIPKELSDICNKACKADPAERFEDAVAFREALEAFMDHRTSNALVQEADRQFGALRDAVQGGEEASVINERFNQALFGYRSALTSWADNTFATAGVQHCLEFMIDRALLAGDRGLAESWIASLPQPHPELERRLNTLSQSQESERQRLDQLQQLERDLDVNVGGKARALVFFTIGIITAIGIELAAIVEQAGFSVLSHPTSTSIAALYLVGLAVIFLAARRWLLPTEFSRRIAQAMVTVQAGVLTVHLVSWSLDIPPSFAHVFVCLVLTFMLAMMGATMDRRLWTAVPMGVLVTVAGATWPQIVLHAQAARIGTCFLVVAWIFHSGEHQAQEQS